MYRGKSCHSSLLIKPVRIFRPEDQCLLQHDALGCACLQFWDEQYWQNFKAEREEEQRNKREAAQRARQARDGV